VVTPLGTGLDYFDLKFLGHPEVIATGLLSGRDGVAIVDPGPSTTLDTLKQELASRGIPLTDVRSILLTHIHLDHAGATGSLVAECPNAIVHVHERGAPHLADPSKLISSASRLYGDDMERLWGEIRPVPADRIKVLSAAADIRLTVSGHTVDVTATPGHASHHVSYFLADAGIAFVGDTAGLCRASGRVVLPATPPPDIDLPAWRRSTDRILGWNPEVLFLTHFGPHRSPRVHFGDFWKRLEGWNRRVWGDIQKHEPDADLERRFAEDVTDELARETSRAEATAYAVAGRFDYSWRGLARYWRKVNPAT
jgi:glyoxylase-like metal-dependent hydrolase (beta-lactamase superfamily II)